MICAIKIIDPMMKHKYRIEGMTCSSCASNVRHALLLLPDVESVDVSSESSSVEISMSQHIRLERLQEALGTKYHLSPSGHSEASERTKDWLATYKPLLILFLFITGISLATSIYSGHWYWMEWMNHFMAAFFLSFSYFKLINIRDFARSYSMYDVIARRLPVWGWIYPFVELALGFAYLVGYDPWITNVVAIVVMGVASIGVIRAVLLGQQIRCACLGDVFKLPMSTITIVEDLLMTAMAAIMLSTL